MKEKLTTVTNIKHLAKGKTNWSKIKRLSDKAVAIAAKNDPDAQPATKAKLLKFKRVNPPQKVNVKAIRKNLLHFSQTQFADYFGISKRTVQEWEQGRSRPNALARNFLKVIECEPQAVRRALGGDERHHGTR